MNVLTFDVEDWYCNCVWTDMDWEKYEYRLQPWMDKILEELEKRQVTATFFCLGWVADHHPELIRKIHSMGHHIGCHSYQHGLLKGLSRDSFVEETKRAKHLLEDVVGVEVDAYRAPAWSVGRENVWVLEELARLGFKYDSSIFPSTHSFGGFPDFGKDEPVLCRVGDHSIREFPVSVRSLFSKRFVFSGGGYFRFFPFPLVKRWISQKNYNLCYFHTQDFDAEQPVVRELPLERRFKTYYGISGAFAKFRRFLDECGPFVDVRTAAGRCDWNMNVVDLN
ncbi:MAG: polysaccharide deacetylase family protein [Paludibacteraceae bacterium]|nr:polysaccharide deacetylase family protein [Paludibacteraceae bacterium]